MGPGPSNWRRDVFPIVEIGLGALGHGIEKKIMHVGPWAAKLMTALVISE